MGTTRAAGRQWRTAGWQAAILGVALGCAVPAGNLLARQGASDGATATPGRQPVTARVLTPRAFHRAHQAQQSGGTTERLRLAPPADTRGAQAQLARLGGGTPAAGPACAGGRRTAGTAAATAPSRSAPPAASPGQVAAGPQGSAPAAKASAAPAGAAARPGAAVAGAPAGTAAAAGSTGKASAGHSADTARPDRREAGRAGPARGFVPLHVYHLDGKFDLTPVQPRPLPTAKTGGRTPKAHGAPLTPLRTASPVGSLQATSPDGATSQDQAASGAGAGAGAGAGTGAAGGSAAGTGTTDGSGAEAQVNAALAGVATAAGMRRMPEIGFVAPGDAPGLAAGRAQAAARQTAPSSQAAPAGQAGPANGAPAATAASAAHAPAPAGNAASTDNPAPAANAAPGAANAAPAAVDLAATVAAYDRLRAADAQMQRRFAAIGAQIAKAKLSGVIAARLAAAHDTYAAAMAQVLGPMSAPVEAVRQAVAAGKPVAAAEQAAVAKALAAVQPALAQALAVPPRAKLRAGLPYRREGLAPAAPVTSPTVTPAYGDPNAAAAGAADLAGTPEAPLAPEIVAQASSLGFDYVQIFQWVRNQVRTEWYAGSMKGAIGTLRQGAGNDVDQASLLIALLRASGGGARYVHGVVQLPVAALAVSLGVADSPAAAATAAVVDTALSRAGVAHAPVIAGGQVAAFTVDHTWVEAYLPYNNYRGAVVDVSGAAWVPLAPAIKAVDDVPPTGVLRQMGFSVDGLITSTLAAPQVQDPLAALRQAVNAFLAQQPGRPPYAQQLGSRAVHAVTLGLLPNTMPAPVVAVTSEAPQVAAAAAHQINLVARVGPDPTDAESLQATLPVWQVAGERFTLSYIPATADDQLTVELFGGLDAVPVYLVQLLPQLNVDGVATVVGETPVPMGVAHRLEVTLLGPFGSETIDETLTAGSYYAIAVGAEQAIAPPALPAGAPPDPSDAESEGAHLLAQEAVNYSQSWDQAEIELGGLLDVGIVRPLPSLAVVADAVAIDQVESLPYALRWQGVTLDAPLRVAEPFARGADATTAFDWMRLSALEGSALEHTTFEGDFEVDSISADKGLGVAAQANVAVLHLTAQNGAQLVPTLQLPATVVADIQNWLRLGMTVDVPIAPIGRFAWTGAVWRVEDPASGGAAYMIAGGLAGGATAESPDQWTLDFLKNALADPYGSQPNTDALAAASMVKVSATDQQIGTVGKTLPMPLAVLVRDAQGRPVVGASVTFTTKQSVGKLIDPVTGTQSDSVTVQADQLGRASVSAVLDQLTSDSPYYLERNPGDVHVTLALAQLIDASVSTHQGALGVDQGAFTMFGMPDTPTQLVDTFNPAGTSYGGMPGMYAGDIWVVVQDQYGNPVSNVPVLFDASSNAARTDLACTNAGSGSGNGGSQAMGAAVFDADNDGCGNLPSPMIGQCGSPTVTILSSSYGAVAGVILGNDVTQVYTVKTSADGLGPISYPFYPSASQLFVGNLPDETKDCVPIATDGYMAWQSQDVKLQIEVTAKIGQTCGQPLTVTLMSWMPDYQVRFNSNGNPYLFFLPTGTWVTDQGTVQVSVSNGGSAAAGVYDSGTHGYFSQLTAGPAPGFNTATVQATINYQYPQVNGGAVELGSFTDNFAPMLNPRVLGFWGIDPQVTATNPQPIALDTNSQVAADTQVQFQVPPAAYDAPYNLLNVLVNGQVTRTAVATVVPGSGGGSVYIPRGTTLKVADTNQAQLVVNAGAAWETRSDLFTLPLHQGIFAQHSPAVYVSQDVDVLNQRFCSNVAPLSWTQAQAAKIKLTVAQISSVNTDGSANTDPEQTLFDSTDYGVGQQSVAISPAGGLPGGYQLAPGTYQYTLHAVSDYDGSTEDVTGTIISEYRSRDSLPVGHMIVKGIDLFDGHVAVQRSDISLPGHGPALELTRGYASNSGDEPGPLGVGWSHSYDSKAVITPCGDIIVIGGEGSGMRFVGDGQGNYVPLKGYHGSLVANTTDNSIDFYAKSGRQYHFIPGNNNEFPLTYIKDPNGLTTRLTYDNSDATQPPLLLTVADDSGRTLSFQYQRQTLALTGEQRSLISEIDGPDGMSMTYQYDPYGNMTQASREGGSRIESYTYAVPPNYDLKLRHKLLTVKNELDGATTTYQYQFAAIGLQGNVLVPAYNVIQLTEPAGGVTQFNYDLPSLSSRASPVLTVGVTDPLGKATTYSLNQYGSAVQIVDALHDTTQTTWAANDVVMTGRTDANGNATSYTYDGFGNELSQSINVVDVQGQAHAYSIQTTYWPPSTFTPPYIKDRVQTRIDRNGTTTSYTYDPTGNLTQKQVTVHDASGGTSTNTVAYTYYQNGDRASMVDARGYPTFYTYDPYGNLASTTDPLRGVASSTWSERSLPLTHTDALGNVTTLTYDTLNRVTSKTYPKVGSTTAVELTAYDDVGDQVTATDAEGRVTVTSMDLQQRPIQVQNAANAIKVTTWDLAGNKTLESDWSDASHPANNTTFTYNDAERLAERDEPLGRVTQYAYDGVGNVASETILDAGASGSPPTSNFVSRITAYAYDALNRRIRTDRTGGSGLVSTLWTLDGNGNQVQIQDPLGRLTTQKFDELNRLIQKDEPAWATGHPTETVSTYDGNGNLVKETRRNLPQDRVHTTVYDPLNRPVLRTDSLGDTTSLAYDAVGNLLQQIDPLQNVVTWSYDPRNRMTQKVVQLTRITRPARTLFTNYTYDRVNNRLSEQLPNGDLVTHTYDPLNRPLAVSDTAGPLSATTYDPNGDPITTADANGNLTSNHYDALHRMVEQDLPVNRKVLFAYDVAGNRVAQTDPNGNTTTYQYDRLDRLVQTTDPAPFSYTAAIGYDAAGNRIAQTDRRGNTTSFAYDSLNRLVQTTAPAPLNYTQSFSYDGLGNKVAEVDRRGTLSQFNYDPEGRLIATTKAGIVLQGIQYDADGNRQFVTDANGNVTSYQYDERNLVLIESRPLAALTTYTLDNMGDRLTVTDPELRVTTHTYDLRRRMLTDTDNAGDTTTYTYDGVGNRLQKQRPAFAGKPWTYTYDGANRLTQVQDPLGNQTTYTYDLNSNRTAIVDAESRTTQWAFDALNRATSKTYPDTAAEHYGYDPNGNRTSLQDADGQTIGYSYDNLDRQVAAAYPPPAVPTGDDLSGIAFTYDPNNNPTAIAETWTGAPATRQTVRAYDLFDRLQSVTDRYNLTLAYTYDPIGNRTSLQDPDSNVTRYTYDALNRLTAVNIPTAGISNYDYFRDSRLKTVTYPNGAVEATTYDAAARVQVLENRETPSSPPNAVPVVLSHFEYQYDPDGNRTQQLEIRANGAAGGETTTYAYDAADRLSSATYADQKVTYTYDRVGDRLTENAVATAGGVLTNHLLAYNARHQLTTITDNVNAALSVAYTYDANGNQTSKTQNGTTTTFQFDVRDQLTAVVQGSSTLGTYEYDYKGLRVLKQGALGYIHYAYDDKSVLLETDASGTTLAKYDYGPDRLLSLNQQTEGRSFYLFDSLGSVTDLTTTSGALRATYQYDAWGNFRATSGGSFNAFGFTGHERDAETGLYYFRARYYDPATGRFLTEDSREGHPDTPPSLHRYLYAYANPTVWTDPTGQFSWSDAWEFTKTAVKTVAVGTAIVAGTAAAIAAAPAIATVVAVGAVAAGVGVVANNAINRYKQQLDDSPKASVREAIAVGLADTLGATAGAEAIGGVEVGSGRRLSDKERAQRGGEAVGTVATFALAPYAAGAGAAKGAAAKQLAASVLDSSWLDNAVSQGIREGAEAGVAELKPDFEVPTPPETAPPAVDGPPTPADPAGEAAKADSEVPNKQKPESANLGEDPEGAGVKQGKVETTKSAAPNAPDEHLFPNLTDEELDQAFDNAQSNSYFQLPGQNPGTGEGLIKIDIKADPNANLKFQNNMTFKGIAGAPGKKVQVRYHSANSTAPAGSYSSMNPTTQINTTGTPKQYMLPDGTWKPMGMMTDLERALVHFQ
jgi:RHS repeat-associated protein